jgi:hypothetical protein
VEAAEAATEVADTEDASSVELRADEVADATDVSSVELATEDDEATLE